VRVLALLALLAAPTAGAVQMYKCVDAKGVTHYSEAPIPGCKGKEVDIQPLPAPSGKEVAPSRELGVQEGEFRRRQLERGRAAEKAAAEAKAREQRCQSLRAEHGRVSSARRLVQVDAKGERSYADDSERERRLARLQEDIAKACS
jgi:Domain of unknown function (DUF4124)